MKSFSYRALAVMCVATLAAAACARNPVTGPDAPPPLATAADDLDDMIADGVEKVTICHFPPGNPENMQTITVGAPAVEPHMRLHGDLLGECEEAPPE